MKFYMLQIGQEFLFKDQAYIKTSPLLGSHKTDGEQKMFKRADVVSLCTATEVVESGQQGAATIDVSVLDKLLDGFINECQAGIESIDEDFSQLHSKKLHSKLQLARQHLITKINAKNL